MSSNLKLNRAKQAKKDEFYTQLSDIEEELQHYTPHFRDKVVYCNCDDPRVSNFFFYFVRNFKRLGLKRLIASGYIEGGRGVWGQYFGRGLEDIRVGRLGLNGDFRNRECIKILEKADIVVTNPPFSLFREHFAQLIEYNKKFLIIGNLNAITYVDFFPFIKDRRVTKGVRPRIGDMLYRVPNDYMQEGSACKIIDGNYYTCSGNTTWFTNMKHGKYPGNLVLNNKYSSEEHPIYDNYDAINVDKTASIPMDWGGVMGVPISFLDKWNPDQFEIIEMHDNSFINGKKLYKRLLIRNRNPVSPYFTM